MKLLAPNEGGQQYHMGFAWDKWLSKHFDFFFSPVAV